MRAFLHAGLALQGLVSYVLELPSNGTVLWVQRYLELMPKTDHSRMPLNTCA